MKSELEKMVAGELYRAADPELLTARTRARRLFNQYNRTEPDETALRRALLKELFGSIGEVFDIEPDFRCDYGFNIHAGNELFMNFGCVILDVCEVRMGHQVFFAPGVHIYTATHPLDAAERGSGVEYGKPVVIGNRVWLGGGVRVLPGVTIGDDVVIGAGSVVTRDIPSGVVAAGNPCRVMRPITETDRMLG